MGNHTTLNLTVTLHSNGLALVTLIEGQGRARRVVARAHVTYEPDEGLPYPRRLLQHAVAEILAAFQG